MRKFVILLCVVVAALVLSACGSMQRIEQTAPLEAQRLQMHEALPDQSLPSPSTARVNETPALWFVEFAGPPTAKGGSSAALRNQRAAFRRAAAAEAIQFTERFNFERLFNGLSVKASLSEIGKISRLPNVVAVYPVLTFDAPEPEVGATPDMKFALDMTGARTAQQELGLSGNGIRVAIMDTGIDYNHPDLGGGWGNRVVKGYDFVGDNFDASNPALSTPQPDTDPMAPWIVTVTVRTSPALLVPMVRSESQV